jgi:hypothetical protein
LPKRTNLHQIQTSPTFATGPGFWPILGIFRAGTLDFTVAMAATHRMRMNIVKDLRAFLWRVSFLGLLGVGAWLSLNHVSEGQPAPSKSRTPQQIVADLGILREATNMGRFAPSCDAQINAVIGLGENVRPLLLEGLNDKNLLMVANCSNYLGSSTDCSKFMSYEGRGRDAGYPAPPHRSRRAEPPHRAPTLSGGYPFDGTAWRCGR